MKRVFSVVLLLAVVCSIAITAVGFASADDTGFSDVDADAWYAEEVAYVCERGLMNGTTDTTFSPGTPASRGTLAEALYRASGSPRVTSSAGFSDISADAWCVDAVNWAAANQIISGYPGNRFGADDPVTREQAAAILWRYTGSPSSAQGQDFADEDRIAPYAADAVDWARSSGVINGRDGNRFDPKSNITRAEIAVILHNYMTRIDNSSADTSANDARVLIAYFSRVGNTNFAVDVDAVTSASINRKNQDIVGNNQLVAESIHALMGGDLVEIISANPYPADYDDTVAQNRREMQDGTLPNISTTIDAADYDIVFIGYPIWAMTMPAPVKTFLTQYDFAGKTVVPFCTHAGYGAGQTEAAIREMCPDANVLPVLAVDDDDLDRADTLVSAWLDELNLTAQSSSPNAKTTVHITVGDTVITAELNDSPAAREFAQSLPATVSMTRMGEHEYYGALEKDLTEDGNTLQTGYTVGDLAFWTPGDLFALYFDEPETPPQGLIILGHITSDMAVFDDLGGRESMRITLAE